MKKYIPILFMVLGVADLIYGLWSGDRLSILVGVIIIIIAVSIIRKGKQKEKDESSEKNP